MWDVGFVSLNGTACTKESVLVDAVLEKKGEFGSVGTRCATPVVSGTQSLFNFTVQSHDSTAAALGFTTVPTVPSPEVFPPKLAASTCTTPATLHRATHLCPSCHQPLEMFPRATQAGRIQGQVLSTPISRELLESVDRAWTHMRILILFRDTLELKSP